MENESGIAPEDKLFLDVMDATLVNSNGHINILPQDY